MAEWLKATDCKSVLSRVRRFEPYSAHSSFEFEGFKCSRVQEFNAMNFGTF
jgi:hypothetical protein